MLAALTVVQLLCAQAAGPATPATATPTTATTTAATTTAAQPAAASGDAVVDPAAAATTLPPLPSTDELQRLAERDIGQARGSLRRAARTADTAAVRGLALRLLATHDASVATARICARSLRLDDDAGVRRAAAECLGRLGPRLAAPHTPALVAALDDPSLDVLTMAGWALANAGDAAGIGPLTARASHEDVRVAKLFYGYAERLRDRLGLRYETSDPTTPPRPSDDAPTAIPPGVVLAFPAASIDSAAATGWLGLYGAMIGWIHGPLLMSAHGGLAGAEAGALAGLGLSAFGAAALSGYGFARADNLQLAHTVVQLGTMGGLAGYGAGQLSAVGPASGVASANLSMVGTLVGIGTGMAFVEIAAPGPGALTAGAAVGGTVGVTAGTLAASYRYPFNQSLGVMLLAGSVTGAATTALLHNQDVGLFPVAGATLGAGVVGGTAAVVASAIEPAVPTERSGWLVVSGVAAGAALGGVLGWMAPVEHDPFLEGTLKLNPPTIGVIPGAGVRPEPATALVLSGVF